MESAQGTNVVQHYYRHCRNMKTLANYNAHRRGSSSVVARNNVNFSSSPAGVRVLRFLVRPLAGFLALFGVGGSLDFHPGGGRHTGDIQGCQPHLEYEKRGHVSTLQITLYDAITPFDIFAISLCWHIKHEPSHGDFFSYLPSPRNLPFTAVTFFISNVYSDGIY